MLAYFYFVACIILGSFEITVGDSLIFSKLHCGRFPEPMAVVNQISAIASGQKPETVTEYEESSCVLL
ncbi:hypothetical protein D915_010084 [Fasciola hepatica]|uniref:Uncharacterized protein n=1 Tax=Fasciola hepatica TaxID=6192 RepID=A0A4E0QVQ4_FASHE|nr:hypothetical protein D915_010084 [Fasciola hepatica]